MFRTARRIAPLLNSLLFGAALATGVMVSASALVGCADENDPETHVKKLADVSTRTAAVNRLIQFFEDAMTRDNRDRNGPTVKPLLDKIMGPMNELCVAGDLEAGTNSKLVKFLSDARDPRAEGCLVKTLKDYKPDATEDDVRWASRAVGALQLKAASPPLLDVFKKIHPSKPKAGEVYRDVHDALLVLNDTGWEGELIAVLGRPIADRKDGGVLKDEAFWQITAAELLGAQKSAKAVKPLIKEVLSPLKADIAATAVNALIKIGKASIAPAIALLKSQDKELMEYCKAETLKASQGPDGKVPDAAAKAAEKAHIGTAAIILSSIGREEASTALIEAMGTAGDDLSKAIIARELGKVPKTPELVKAFQAVYEKVPASLTIPPGNGAKEALIDTAGSFYDASLVPWLIKTSKDLKGDDSDIDPIRAAALAAVMKLMTKDQIGDVQAFYSMKATGADGKPSTLGKGYENEWKAAKDLATSCADKVECYLAKIAEPASQAKETQFQGIKAGYMIGVYGNADSRAKLIDAMPKLSNAAVRYVAVTVIDYLSPKGDPGIAAKLQKIVDDGDASKDPNRMAGNAPFKTVIYRLNARAQ